MAIPFGLNPSNYIGTDFWVAFGPQYNIEHHDQEPCGPTAGVSNATAIKGAVTGVPKLGSAMYLAFVGESVDARWFGAADAPTSWGDGGSGYTHTYSAPGGYWVTSGSPALAARFCRVIYRTRPAAGVTFFPLDVSYPCAIAENVSGDLGGTFAFQGVIQYDTQDFLNSNMGYITERSLVGVFAQEYRSGSNYGNTTMVAGGFITNRQFIEDPNGKYLKFAAYGPSFWMSIAYMREMLFIDPGIIGADLASANTVKVNGGNPLTQDVFGVGYIANHWIKCDCVIAALHIIQHTRVYASTGDDPTNVYSPSMAANWGSNSYGNPGQFWDITTDADVDESAGKTIPGFTDFNMNAGMVWANLKQTLENEGFRIYDRGDMTQRVERKPYYRTVQPATKLVIDDVSKLVTGAGEPFSVSSGTQKNVAQVQVEKPMLSVLSDMTNTGTTTYGGNTLTIRDPATLITTGDDFTHLPGTDPLVSAVSGLWTGAISSNTFGSNNNTLDPLDQSIDPNQFLVKYPATPRGFGEFIGPLKNVFSLNPLAYAIGRDKEERAHWTAILPLGQVIGVDVGDVVELTYTNSKMGVKWVSKLFEVSRRRSTLDPKGAYFCIVELIELNPDDGLTSGSGANAPGIYVKDLIIAVGGLTSTSISLVADAFQISAGDSVDYYLNGVYNSTGTLDIVITGLSPSTNYSVYARGKTAAGEVSQPSAILSFTTPA